MDFASRFAYVANDSDEEEDLLPPAPAPALAHPSAPAPARAQARVPGRAAPPPPPAKPERLRREKLKKVQVDANVLAIKLGDLAVKADAEVETGDPQFCSHCQAALFSPERLIWFKDRDDQKKIDELYASFKADEKVLKDLEDKRKSLKEGEAIWSCDFCYSNTVLLIDPEEVPKPGNSSLDFILEPPEVPVKDSDSKEAEKVEESKIIIFCIDVSGSMCVSQQAPGDFKVKGRENQEDPFAFLPADDPDLLAFRQAQGMGPKTTWVTRLEAVQSAVETQIERISKDHPSYVVGLVSFESDVTIWGDGKASPLVIAGSKLNKEDEIRTIAKEFKLSAPVSESKAALLKRLYELKDKNQTALGPGLVAALELASGKAGSKVILCTDGLANIGVGSITESDKDGSVTEWYRSLGSKAASAGVAISVISITDGECSLQNLGEVADLTGGNVERVNPLDLGKNLHGIVSNNVLATSVSATMIIHQGLKFKNVIDDEVQVKGYNSITKEVGNAFKDTEIFFEYSARSKAERKKFTNLSELPFQVQIKYVRLDGAKCVRVISKKQKFTRDRGTAQKDVQIDVLAANAAQLSAVHARRGSFAESDAVFVKNRMFMARVAQREEQKTQVAQYAEAMSGLNSAIGDLIAQEADAEEDDQADIGPPVIDAPMGAVAAHPAPAPAFGPAYAPAYPPPAPASVPAYAVPQAGCPPPLDEVKMAKSGHKPKVKVSDQVASEIFKLKKSNKSTFNS